MFINLLKVALRNLKRQKSFAILNTLGLTFGLVSCLFIWMYSSNEMSYDTFHEKADRIYRINQTFIWGDDDQLFGSTGPAVMQAISDEVPEFERMTRVHMLGNTLVTPQSADDKLPIFEEEKILAVDSTFLDIFTFPLKYGNPAKALTNPYSIILTSTAAIKYFGTDEVLGKTLELGEAEERQSYMITGVAQDIPKTSHIDFDFLVSMTSIPRLKNSSDSWIWTTFVTFGLLRPDANPELVATKVAAVPGKYLDAFLQKYRGITYQEFLESGEEWNLYIQPFLDIHLRSVHVYSRLNEIGDIRTIYMLALVCGLILALSVINFVNLSTARATSRAREVGVRKVIGSSRASLIKQVLIESTLFVVVASVLALLLAEVLLPQFNILMERDLALSTYITSPFFITGFVAFCLFLGVLSGIYPAYYISSFQPAQALKTKVMEASGKVKIRNVLVATQFVISIASIGCTLFLRDQINFLQNRDLGFSRDNKLMVQHIERLPGYGDPLQNAILQHPLVQNATISSHSPLSIHDFDNFNTDDGEDRKISVNYLTCDERFLDVYHIEMLHGRNFDKAFNEANNIVVNEELTRAFGFESPQAALNQSIRYYDEKFKIVGISKDFHSNTSVAALYPTAFFAEYAPIYRDKNTELSIDLREDLKPEEIQSIIKTLEQNWYSMTSTPFEYTFLDQEYSATFKDAEKLKELLQITAILTVIIACMGLLGLMAFVIEKRNKEIGIRKVLGASVASIWLLFSKSYALLILIGFIVASPVSWFIAHSWLETYEIQTTLSFGTLAMAGGLMLVMAVLTTSIQIFKAANMNPVDYLKDE